MELQSVAQTIYRVSLRLEKAADELYKLGKDKANAERDYVVKFAQEIMKLKDEGTPTAIIRDLAKANSSAELFQMEYAEVRFKSAVESLGALKTEVSALQSILRYQTEI